MSKTVSIVGVKSVDFQGKRTLMSTLPSTVKIFDVNIEMDKFKLGSLDAMLQGLDKVTRLESTCENFLKRIEKIFIDLEPDKNLFALTIDALHGGQVSLLKYLQNFNWDDSNYPRTSNLVNQLKNFEEKLISLDKILKIRLASYQETKTKLSMVGDKRETLSNFLNGDLNDIIFEEVSTRKLEKPEKLFVNSTFFQSIIVYVPKANFELFAGKYELDVEYIVPQSLVKILENHDYVMAHVLGFKRGLEEIRGEFKKKYGAITREYEMNLVEAKARETEKKRIGEQNITDKNQLKNSSLEAFKELFVMISHLKFFKVVIDSNLRFGNPDNFAINMLVFDKSRETKIISDLIKNFAEKDKIEFYGTKEQLNDVEDFFPFVYSTFNFSL